MGGKTQKKSNLHAAIVPLPRYCVSKNPAVVREVKGKPTSYQSLKDLGAEEGDPLVAMEPSYVARLEA